MEHIPCGRPANQSEELAAACCVAALRSLGNEIRWVVFSNLASSYFSLHQSDELDFAWIGPPAQQDKAVVHLSNLSATDEKDAGRLAAREFPSKQFPRKCCSVPSFRNAFKDLPNYPGELCFFTLFGPEGSSPKRRATEGSCRRLLRIAHHVARWQNRNRR